MLTHDQCAPRIRAGEKYRSAVKRGNEQQLRVAKSLPREREGDMALGPIEMILYATIVLVGIGAAMVLVVWLINQPSDHHVRAARARAARRRR